MRRWRDSGEWGEKELEVDSEIKEKVFLNSPKIRNF